MAQVNTAYTSSTSGSEVIKLFHLKDAMPVEVEAFKSESEARTNSITESLARSLGHEKSSSVDLQWRIAAFSSLWKDSFEVVQHPTTVAGVTYQVILSGEASMQLLRAKGGSYIALCKTRNKAGEDEKRQKQKEEEAKRRVEREREEEERRRQQRYRREISQRQPTIAATS